MVNKKKWVKRVKVTSNPTTQEYVIIESLSSFFFIIYLKVQTETVVVGVSEGKREQRKDTFLNRS